MLTRRWAVWLGSISYALYLVHEPLIFYLAFINKGRAEWNEGESLRDEALPKGRLMPPTMIPVHLAVSLLCAVFLHYCFDQPLSKLMRPAKNNETPVVPLLQ